MTKNLSTRHLIAITAIASLIAFLATLSGNWVLGAAIGLPIYLLVPGYFAVIALCGRLEVRLTTFLYAIGLGILSWIVGALAINQLLPHVGIMRPLQLRYLLSLYMVMTAGLGAFVVHSRSRTTLTVAAPLNWPSRLLISGALTLPILAALGATTLNNGGTGQLTMTMVALSAVYVLIVTIAFRRYHQSLYAVATYGVGLALLLMYALRSWHVLGWDIHQEMAVFMATLDASRWRMSSFPGLDYNACLSITILPTIIAKLTHVNPEYVFKLLYQVLFATVPVAVYAAARRFLLPVLAFIASIFFIAETWYFELMPALARQEIAIIFFALFMLVLTDNALKLRPKRLLLLLFSTGIILSHYSTAYLWITMCVVAYLIMAITRLLSKTARADVKGLTWPLLLSSILMIALWEGPATRTYQSANNTFSNFGTQMTEAFSPTAVSQAIHAVVAGAPGQTPSQVQAASASAEYNRPPNYTYYNPQTYANYHLVSTSTTVDAQNLVPSPLAAILHEIVSLTKVITNNILTLLGIFIVAFYFLRRFHKSNFDFVAISMAAYLLVFVILMIPYLQQIYNLPRVGLQSFTLLVVPVVAGLWFLVRRSIKYGLPLIALIAAIMLVGQTGLVDQFTGGSQRITMDARGTLDSFYVSDDEIAAAKWLGATDTTNIPIYADALANLRLIGYTNVKAAHEEIFPSALPITAYVYLSDYNTERGITFYALHNNTLNINTPTTFLTQNKNLLYSAGGAEIYR